MPQLSGLLPLFLYQNIIVNHCVIADSKHRDASAPSSDHTVDITITIYTAIHFTKRASELGVLLDREA